jgi:hypothetical protein
MDPSNIIIRLIISSSGFVIFSMISEKIWDSKIRKNKIKLAKHKWGLSELLID